MKLAPFYLSLPSYHFPLPNLYLYFHLTKLANISILFLNDKSFVILLGSATQSVVLLPIALEFGTLGAW